MGEVKISSLELENVKRIRALQLEPTPEGLTVIGGRNAQGKTSVLDAIAWALGGNKMKPEAPNRDGAANPARLHVELSNGIVVERSGKNGSLKVTDARGMKGGQALLDEFVGQLALDLPRFLEATDKGRADYLLGILGVSEELGRIERDIKATYDERRYVGQDADRKAKAAQEMRVYEDAPSEPISVLDLSIQLQAAMETNAENQRQREEAMRLRSVLERHEREVGILRQKLVESQKALDDALSSRDACEAECEAAKRRVSELRDIDTSPISSAIEGAEAANAKLRANVAREEAESAARQLRSQYDAMTNRLETLRGERVALLDNAGMPLKGLSVEDGVLTYNGHVWSDMSGAEQLRVATAIVRATKPECGFVLVDKLEQFDTQQLTEFAEWCEGEGLQVIGTRVATDDSCTVVIEDGRIVGQEMDEAPTSDPRGESVPWGDEF